MSKYHAYIKGRELLNNWDENTQWIVVNKGMSSEYIGLSEPDDFEPLTKEEWANIGINEDNANFVKEEELEE